MFRQSPVVERVELFHKEGEKDGINACVREKRALQRMRLKRYEQETIVNYNAEDKTATLYTRDSAF